MFDRRGLGAGAALALVAGLVSAAPDVRVVQDHGTWWFQDAAGRQFFSLGVDCVAGCVGHAEDRPLEAGQHDRIVGQLKAWGFNTAGAWSRPSVWPDLYVADQLYMGVTAQDFHDVYDEAFWHGWFPGQVTSEVGAFRGRKNVIGYFVDNEPHWDPAKILAFFRALKPGAPGRKALAAFAKRTCGGRLDRVDAAAWRTEAVRQYYTRYVALLRAADPDRLVLGVRWAGLPDLELYRALSPLFDVNSVNDYNRYGDLRPAYAEVYAATGKPIMITEWSFSGYPEPGHASLQFIDVFTQERRAVGYRKYVSQAARAPYMVGMHWFLWSDYEPQVVAAGGYPPDENMGLVTNDGATPYDILVRECARTNGEVEALHRAAGAPRPAVAVGTTLVEASAVGRASPVVDGDLADWPMEAFRAPRVSESLEEVRDPGHAYALAADGTYLYVAARIRDGRLDDPGRDWEWEGDYLALYAALTAGPAGTRGASTALYLYPLGGGADRKAPVAGFWGGASPGAGTRIARRDVPGGYTLEARFPLAAFAGWKSGTLTPWTWMLNYRDDSGIYETWWERTGALPAAP